MNTSGIAAGGKKMFRRNKIEVYNCCCKELLVKKTLSRLAVKKKLEQQKTGGWSKKRLDWRNTVINKRSLKNRSEKNIVGKIGVPRAGLAESWG